MASIIQRGDRWMARVRRKGFPPQTDSFGTKILAEKWARRIEADMDAGRAGVAPKHGPTIGDLVKRYTEEVGRTKPFGRNKEDVLKRIELHLEKVPAHALTPERVVDYIRKDRGIAGVTAGIDLTYLKGVLKVARALWRVSVQPSVVDDAREILRHMGLMARGNRRDRRATQAELDALRGYFDKHSGSLTADVFDFILASCFRPPSEVTGLRWADLNEEDRTIVIHDRKDPRRKLGNDQTVPLLNGSFDIVMRQPKGSEFIFPVNGKSWSSIFPRACKALGIADLRLYDMRHEAITRLVESGKYSLAEQMLVSGHRDPRQLSTYTQLRAKDLHDR
jgi:integrase